MMPKQRVTMVSLILPFAIVFLAFFLLPMARLALESIQGEEGLWIYVRMLSTPRYLETLLYTLVLSLSVTLVTLILSGICGVFLQRNTFFGKQLLVALLAFPLAFPGVVVGFMIILLAGRQGLLGSLSLAHLFCHGHGGFWDRLHPGHGFRCPAHRHLHRIHPVRQCQHGLGPVHLPWADHLGRPGRSPVRIR